MIFWSNYNKITSMKKWNKLLKKKRRKKIIKGRTKAVDCDNYSYLLDDIKCVKINKYVNQMPISS